LQQLQIGGNAWRQTKREPHTHTHTRAPKKRLLQHKLESAWAPGGGTHEITEHAAALVTTERQQQMCVRATTKQMSAKEPAGCQKGGGGGEEGA